MNLKAKSASDVKKKKKKKKKTLLALEMFINLNFLDVKVIQCVEQLSWHWYCRIELF